MISQRLKIFCWRSAVLRRKGTELYYSNFKADYITDEEYLNGRAPASADGFKSNPQLKKALLYLGRTVEERVY